jgi:hypothetical protein
MPLITYDFKIPANTPKTAPKRDKIKVPAGVLRRIWILIPPGHRALAHMVIKHGETQIIPHEGVIHGDSELIVLDEYYEFKTDDVITLEGWNDDPYYFHTFYLRFLIQPPLLAAPELELIKGLRVMLEAMGVL